MAKGSMEGGGVRGSLLPRQGRQGYRDMTNPRNLYSLLSNNRKLSDSGLSSQSNRSYKEKSFLPSLNTDVNIRVEGYRPLRRLSQNSRKLHQSTLELSNRAKLPTLTLLRPSASMEDLASLEISAKHHNSVHSRLEPITLPAIRHRRGRVTFKDQDQQYGGLDRVPERDDVFEDDPRLLKDDASPSINGDPRIERWFMQMPDDVLDKAHRLLMQEAIRERLLSGNTPTDRTFDLPRARSRNKMQISDLRDYSQYPGSYWELRENTVHDPRDLENDMIDRDIYRLRQKSLLKLSSISRDFRDGYGRRGRAVEVSPIPPPGSIKSRPRRRHPALYPPDPSVQYQSYWESLNVSPAVKFMLAHVPSDGDGQSHKALSLGGSSVPPPPARLARAAREDVLAAKEKIRSVGRPRNGPKPKVVTLEIGGGDAALPPRLPRHLEEGLLRNQRQSAASSGDSSGRSAISGTAPTLPTIAPSEGSVAETVSSTSNDKRGHGKGENKRAMLKGYNQLQVFGELRRQGERSQGESESRLIEIPAEPKKYLPPTRAPVYKLDLRHRRRLTSQGGLLPQLTDTELKLASSPLLSMAPKRKETTAISIRFEDGKVILSRNNTNLEEEEKTSKTGARSDKAGEIAGDSVQVNPSSEGAMT